MLIVYFPQMLKTCVLQDTAKVIFLGFSLPNPASSTAFTMQSYFKTVLN